jgi:DNA-binding MarR family transcriptional regulator
MSSDPHEKRAELLRDLARELREFNGLGASLFRAAAARAGMTLTDLQVIDVLDGGGPTTAGQLAEVTGLTTGAITGMLNRLEEAGLVRRERDPEDGRRVIVHLERDKDETQRLGAIFASLGTAWNETASRYDDVQLAFLLDFLKRSNTISRQQTLRLREAPEAEGEILSAPLGDLDTAQLVVSSVVSRLTVRADKSMADLYQARFEGPPPEEKVKDGVVTLRYPRRLWVLSGGGGRSAEVTLHAAIPWRISIQGGASVIAAELGGLNLAGLQIKGGVSMIRLELPVPSGEVPIRISGGASEISIRRPEEVAARVHLKGWASTFVFDDQQFSDLGSDVRLQSPGYATADQRYDIEVSSSASMVTISSA